MSTKVKGLFKGLRYISHIFDGEEEEEEIQIGLPTDVKHVAHIGWEGEGPSAAAVGSAPSWMNEFKSSPAFQSAPLGSPGSQGAPRDAPEIKWVSEDSRRGNRALKSQRSDLPDLPKSSRRQSANQSGASDPPKKEKKSRSRRIKDSDGSMRSSRRQKESNEASVSGLPDIPKKSRRKKSRDTFSNEGSSRRSNGGRCNDPFSDLGSESGRTPEGIED